MDTVDVGVFARAWAVHRRRLAWLVGAGTSAAAGVPTAARIVDDLLVRMYADQFDLIRQNLDTTDPAVMAKIRQHYDGHNGMPALGSASDDSTAFRLAMPDPTVRGAYFRQLVENASPCFGQRVLGAAITSGVVDIVITTNFDELLERAMAEAHGRHSGNSARLCSVAALGSVDRAASAFASDQWPLLVKIHGDYRESQLKNLATELQEQDADLRRCIVDASRRFGFIVDGYSGRDESVMDMLRESCDTPGAWPAGIWSLARDPNTVSAQTLDFLTAASAAGVQVHLVRAYDFNEVMGSLANQVEFDPGIREYVDGLRPAAVAADAPPPTIEAGPFPVLRTNALPITSAPESAWSLPVGNGFTRDQLIGGFKRTHFRGVAVVGQGHVFGFGDAQQLRDIVGSDAQQSPRRSRR